MWLAVGLRCRVGLVVVGVLFICYGAGLHFLWLLCLCYSMCGMEVSVSVLDPVSDLLDFL